ncbi:LysM peptidoglycan-binding domain-containing protein [Geotalea sp. SG265]|uniref:LysM peptidoglycan-binding domain-containing protein n=1 Tax=Geotalea sp. SG265 TaxID=2922867 RepID=UPI001FAEC6B4|nr:LysM peptidoglycan-binding domain-containing protein [Geotalea sp. SG265]
MRRFPLTRFLQCCLLMYLIAGCSTPVPLWRQDALSLLERVRNNDGQKLLPAEYQSIEDLVLQGDTLVQKEEIEEADKLYLLAWSKANLLEKNLLLEKRRLAEETSRREAERLEAERQHAVEEENRKRAEKLATEARAAREAEARRLVEKAEKARQARQLPTYHTVKRGESLPFIASQSEVYNDRNLWPLLYRANRDQISNPKHLWPGQVLRIPRNASREDLAEARRYAQDRPLH